MISTHPAIKRADRLTGLFDKATVVIFAGLGGVCIGVERAYVDGGFRDKYIDLAVNHWETAVRVHERNHPMTEHLHADVWEVDPKTVLRGRKIGYLHASPDCTDFSKAKGDMPKRKHIRALADVVIVWARERRPDVITLENVEEFKQWGPLRHKRCARRNWRWTARKIGSKARPITIAGPRMGDKDAGWIELQEKRGWSVEPHLEVDPDKRGHEFTRWKKELEALGYVVDSKELWACDYGAPTTRKRLFVIARCDGKPIVWPEATHGRKQDLHRSPDRRRMAQQSGGSGGQSGIRSIQHVPGNNGDDDPTRIGTGRKNCDRSSQPTGGSYRSSEHRSLKPYRTAAECIEWREPMLSIFATRAEARAWAEAVNVGREPWERVGVPQRPLRPKTHARLAGGLFKHVLESAEPFIIQLAHGGEGTWGDGRSGARDARGAVGVSFTAGVGGRAGQSPATPMDAPVPTVTGKGDRVVATAQCAPFTVPRHGERDGQAPRSRSIREPAPTVTPKGNGANLVSVAISKHYGGVVGQDARKPIGSITGVDHHSLLAVSITQDNRNDVGEAPETPLRTIAGTNHNGLLGAHIVKIRGDSNGHPITDPVPTVTSGSGSKRDAGAAHALGVAACYLSHNYTSNTNGGQGDPEKPLKTITGGAHHAGVCVVYLAAFYGRGSGDTGHTPAAPLPTVPSNDRFGLVELDATPHWIFTPAALKRAAQVARWAIKMLGRKVKKHILWVLDEADKKFPLLTLALRGAIHIVTDIAMRMLRPRELARAQGFDDSYVIDQTVDGRRICKADQVKLIGNSVCPSVAQAIAKANVVDLGVMGEPRRRRRREAVLV